MGGARARANGKYSTEVCDKRDDFNFKIVNFPFLCSNIPSGPAYGVYNNNNNNINNNETTMYSSTKPALWLKVLL